MVVALELVDLLPQAVFRLLGEQSGLASLVQRGLVGLDDASQFGFVSSLHIAFVAVFEETMRVSQELSLGCRGRILGECGSCHQEEQGCYE